MTGDAFGEIRAVLDAADDPDALRTHVLAASGLDAATNRPGEAPDNSLEARWARAVAANPQGVLGWLRRTHPPASAQVSGNQKIFDLTLPDGAGRIRVMWMPNGT